MLVSRSIGSLLLLAVTAYAANSPVPVVLPLRDSASTPNLVATEAASELRSIGSDAKPPSDNSYSKPATVGTPPKPTSADLMHPKTGKDDAPFDGADGKPHAGPGIFETKKEGTGNVGISGGILHDGLKIPPPHTGKHEIMDIGDPKEGDESVSKPTIDTDGSGESSSYDSTSHHEHKEYTLPGTDTLLDPPINPPAHLADGHEIDLSSISQPLHSFSLSFIMIIFSEIGDKTFLIAALMAMKNPRLQVFTAALSSLIVMSILSAVLGHAVPALIPKKFTAFLAAGLFLVFGVKMIKEGLEMDKGTANVQQELAEVEAELHEKSRDRASSLTLKMEAGALSAPSRSHSLRRNTSSPSLSDSDEDDYASARGIGGGKGPGILEGFQNLAGLLLSPAWVQTFVMTFLGEWGDRSQIATIAMAAGQDYWYVTIGAVSGHAICTGIAVIGGRMLASRISVRNVTLGGAAAFLVFGILYMGEAFYV